MDNKEKIESLAKEILNYAKNTLIVNFRFLDMALGKLGHTELYDTTIMVDGKRLIYDPRFVIRAFKSGREAVTRHYFHILLHCVFKHMFVNPSIQREFWDIACDIAVESVITELGAGCVKTSDESIKSKLLNDIKSDLNVITAEKLYNFLRERYDLSELVEIQRIFKSDDHSIWYMTDSEKSKLLGNDNSDANVSIESNADLSAEWQRISERMAIDMETFSKNVGNTAGFFSQNLREVTREKYDYTAFLRKFAVTGEKMKLNPDEFDHVFYTYGLQLYKNVPLVEPLEVKEVKSIREFVIAIDSSGSTSGELVQTFLQKTYNILKSTESFFSKINVHIIQCDCVVHEDVKITCTEDFDNYIKTMKILGQGGTDFRPVFEHVERLRKEGEFSNLNGLIYFTDGYGHFPNIKPDYKTAFVFIDDEYNNYDVPAWAIKLILSKGDI